MSRKLWKGQPKTADEARIALSEETCPICNAKMLVSIVRQPNTDWKAHCNCCGMEVTIAVILNRAEWQTFHL
jgi:transcription elongation factor Elf1